MCVRSVYLCSSPSSSFLYALISISRASFTSNSSWYSLSWAFILSRSSLISCSFPSMSLRCLSRSADRISSSSLIRFSDVATYKGTTHRKLRRQGRGLKLHVQVIMKQYLFLQGAQLISQALYPHTRFLHLLPGCAHCLIIHFRGHLGIIQLEQKELVSERLLHGSSSSMQVNALSSRTERK